MDDTWYDMGMEWNDSDVSSSQPAVSISVFEIQADKDEYIGGVVVPVPPALVHANEYGLAAAASAGTGEDDPSIRSYPITSFKQPNRKSSLRIRLSFLSAEEGEHSAQTHDRQGIIARKLQKAIDSIEHMQRRVDALESEKTEAVEEKRALEQRLCAREAELADLTAITVANAKANINAKPDAVLQEQLLKELEAARAASVSAEKEVKQLKGAMISAEQDKKVLLNRVGEMEKAISAQEAALAVAERGREETILFLQLQAKSKAQAEAEDDALTSVPPPTVMTTMIPIVRPPSKDAEVQVMPTEVELLASNPAAAAAAAAWRADPSTPLPELGSPIAKVAEIESLKTKVQVLQDRTRQIKETAKAREQAFKDKMADVEAQMAKDNHAHLMLIELKDSIQRERDRLQEELTKEKQAREKLEKDIQRSSLSNTPTGPSYPSSMQPSLPPPSPSPSPATQPTVPGPRSHTSSPLPTAMPVPVHVPASLTPASASASRPVPAPAIASLSPVFSPQSLSFSPFGATNASDSPSTSFFTPNNLSPATAVAVLLSPASPPLHSGGSPTLSRPQYISPKPATTESPVNANTTVNSRTATPRSSASTVAATTSLQSAIPTNARMTEISRQLERTKQQLEQELYKRRQAQFGSDSIEVQLQQLVDSLPDLGASASSYSMRPSTRLGQIKARQGGGGGGGGGGHSFRSVPDPNQEDAAPLLSRPRSRSLSVAAIHSSTRQVASPSLSLSLSHQSQSQPQSQSQSQSQSPPAEPEAIIWLGTKQENKERAQYWREVQLKSPQQAQGGSARDQNSQHSQPLAAWASTLSQPNQTTSTATSRRQQDLFVSDLRNFIRPIVPNASQSPGPGPGPSPSLTAAQPQPQSQSPSPSHANHHLHTSSQDMARSMDSNADDHGHGHGHGHGAEGADLLKYPPPNLDLSVTEAVTPRGFGHKDITPNTLPSPLPSISPIPGLQQPSNVSNLSWSSDLRSSSRANDVEIRISTLALELDVVREQQDVMRKRLSHASASEPLHGTAAL